MAFTPNSFLAHMRAMGGPAKTNRFEVLLPIPRYIGDFIGDSDLNKLLNAPNAILSGVVSNIFGKNQQSLEQNSSPTISRYLALQCEGAELPGKTLQTADVKVYGPTFKLPYQTQYQDITLTFLSTNDFYERKLFDKWINAIMPGDTYNLRFPKDDDTRYTTKITILQYNDLIKQVYALELIDAFPIGIAAQQLSWSDDNFHRLSVQFAYTKYEPIYESKTDLYRAGDEIVSVLTSRIQGAVLGGASDVVGSVTSRIPGLGGGF